METVKAGIVRGRHDMPVEAYVFDRIEDVFDFDAMKRGAREFVAREVGVAVEPGRAINSAGYADDDVYAGRKRLDLYVTGLTAATAAVIAVCAENGVPLTLEHYDREAGRLPSPDQKTRSRSARRWTTMLRSSRFANKRKFRQPDCETGAKQRG